MARSVYRTIVVFDNYEASLLRKLKKELTITAKRKGNVPPTLVDVIRGAVRTGIHTVYGDNYIYKDLLSEEDLRRLLEGGSEIDSSQFDDMETD